MSDPEKQAKAGRKGGKARAEKLAPEERSRLAREAAMARWSDPAAKLPKATHMGFLQIGELTIPCAVLEDGRRVLMQSGVLTAIGRSGNPKTGVSDVSFELPPFLTANNLKPFVSAELRSSSTPVVFRTVGRDGRSGRRAYGYSAQMLPDICAVFIDAKDSGALHRSQEETYRRCKVLMRGFAKVGIIALVDEATGYQAERERDELQRILEKYIVEAMRPWVARFPVSFFKEVHRLHGWRWHGDARGPRYVGKLINRYIYDRLPPGVHDELRNRNPVANGRRKHRHHQFLTDDTGIPHLDKQIQAVTVLMQAAESKSQFEKMLKRVFPAQGDQQELPDPAEDGDGSDDE